MAQSIDQQLSKIYGNASGAVGSAIDKLYGAGAKAAGGLGELLNRSGEAGAAVVSGRGLKAAGNAFMHGESPQQYDTDTDAILNRSMQGNPALQFIAPRPVLKFATQMVVDPATYAGGSGMLRRGAVSVGEHTLPALMRAGQTIAKRTPAAARPAVDTIESALGEVHNFFAPGGKANAHAARELARTQGAKGVQQWQRLQSLKNATAAVGSHLQGTLQSMYDAALHGLSPQDETKIYRALHYGRVDKLPERLKGPAFAVQNVTRSIAYLRGSGPLRKKLEGMGFQLAEPLKAFDSGAARGVQNAKQFRENYVPLPHDLSPEDAQDLLKNIATKRGGRNLASISDPRLKKRLSEEAIILNNPDLYRQALKGAIRSGARTTAAADLRKQIAQHFAPQQVQTFFKKAVTPGEGELTSINGKTVRGISPSVMQLVKRSSRPISSYKPVQRFAAVPKYIKNALTTEGPAEPQTAIGKMFKTGQNAANIGKATLFTSPTPHMKNIATMTALANPAALLDALGTFGKMRGGFAKPAEQFGAIEDAARAGASGVPNVEQSALTKRLSKGGKPGKAAAKWYDTVGKMLWSFDDAAKAALYRHNLQEFKDPLLAAYHTQQQMVNYHDISPFTEKARLLAPFATWRTKMPGAVLKSVTQHPERALAVNRATGGAFFGQKFTDKNGKTHQFQSPASETSELFDLPEGPYKYGRGALSMSAKVLGDVLGAHPPNVSGKRANNYPTYGINPLTFILKSLPIAGQVQSLTGHGLFKTSPKDELLYLLSGVTSQ